MLFSFLYTIHQLLLSAFFALRSLVKTGSGRRPRIPRSCDEGATILKAGFPILALNSILLQLSTLDFSLYISGTVTKTGKGTQEYFEDGPDRMKFYLDGSRLKANFAALQIKPEI